MSFSAFTHCGHTFEIIKPSLDNLRFYNIGEPPHYNEETREWLEATKAAERRAKQAATQAPPPPCPPPAPVAKSTPEPSKIILGLNLLYTSHMKGLKLTVRSLAAEMGVPRDALYCNREFESVRQKARELFGLFRKKDIT